MNGAAGDGRSIMNVRLAVLRGRFSFVRPFSAVHSASMPRWTHRKTWPDYGANDRVVLRDGVKAGARLLDGSTVRNRPMATLPDHYARARRQMHHFVRDAPEEQTLDVA